MNNMTATEANRNFTAATKIVDESGILTIQKSGKDKYVMMTKERYERMNTTVIYGVNGNGKVKVERLGDKLRIVQAVLRGDSEPVAEVVTCEIPTGAVKVEMFGDTVSVVSGRAEMSQLPEDERKMSFSAIDTVLWDNPMEYHTEEEDGRAEWRLISEVKELVRTVDSQDSAPAVSVEVMLRGLKGNEFNLFAQ